MIVKIDFQKPLIHFFILSYMIFFILFISIGLGFVFEMPGWITTLLQIIAAWSSTFAFIILFKKIYPSLTFIDFVKQQFTSKIRFSVVSTAIIIQIAIIGITVLLLSNNTSTPDLAFSYIGLVPFIISFMDQFIRGPLGEELGWRAYALNELQKYHSPLTSALIIGVLWGFWHTPLWFASGYTGGDLFKYIALFMIGIISFSVIVTLFYNQSKNLLIPIIMHQIFNFSLVLIRGDLLEVLGYVMLFYFAAAVIIALINPQLAK